MNITLSPGIQIKTRNEMNYAQYLSLIEKMVFQNSTTGSELSEEKIAATRLNLQRMKRIDKSFIPEEKLISRLRNSDKSLIWLVLTEAWCGDSAQVTPILNKLAVLSEANVQIRFVLRDENPALMDKFLTGQSRSIPKLVCFNAYDGELLGTWGPRPEQIKTEIEKFKKVNPGSDKKEIHYQVQLLYAKDKGQSLQEDIHRMLDSCIS